jgi:ankyrin repeat protein
MYVHLSLSNASENGEISKVIKLLNTRDVDVNEKGPGNWTPLIYAVTNNHVDVVKLLLQRKDIDVNHAMFSNITAVYMAAAKGCSQIVRLLLRHPNIDITIRSKNGRTPEMCALTAGHSDIVELLRLHSQRLCSHHHLNLSVQKDKYVPLSLYKASDSGVVSGVNALLKKEDVDIHELGVNGSPLMVACSQNHIQIVKMLLKQRDLRINQTESVFGWTALHFAAMEGHVEIVQLLLSNSEIDITIQEEGGNTALAMAQTEEHSEIVRLIAQHTFSMPLLVALVE